MNLLRVYIPAILLLGLFSCKKFIEDKKRQAAMSFITTGHWMVESYLVDTVSVTGEFSGYNFKFNEDGTVDGIKGSVIEEGTWAGDVNTYSITSNFPSAAEPLVRLNGVWVIKDSGLDFVKADRNTSTAVLHLFLKKVP